MEVIGGIAGVAGIIGLGIQIAQILQKEISAVAEADGRILQMVVELHATASGLSRLEEFLDEDSQAPNTSIFNAQGRSEIQSITQRCDSIFRSIVILLAKSEKAALAKVDQYQRDVGVRRNASTQLPDPSLQIEMTAIEHLMWPWR